MARSTAAAEPVIKTELDVIEERIASLEAHCNRQLLKMGSWSYNQAKDFENGDLKDLKELKKKRAAMLRGKK